jgi:integrase
MFPAGAETLGQAMAAMLIAWKLKTGGVGRVLPPMRVDGEALNKKTLGRNLRAALKRLRSERPGLGWYKATRHTFASQWVLAGGSIEKLKEILGHYSVVVTSGTRTSGQTSSRTASWTPSRSISAPAERPEPPRMGPERGHGGLTAS